MKKDNMCIAGLMAVCGCQGKNDCSFYTEGSRGDCMHYRFEEWCDNPVAQIFAGQEPTSHEVMHERMAA